MLLIEWQEVRVFASVLLVLALAIIVLMVARKKRSPIRLAMSFLSACLGFVSFLVLSLMCVGLSCNTYLPPVASPDKTKVAQIDRYDAGATGGGDSVSLHWEHGFRSQVIFAAGWETVEPCDLVWSDSSHLEVIYDGKSAYICKDAGGVHVTCSQRRASYTTQ